MTPQILEQFEWSENGLILLDRINRMIADNGGYILYANEVYLENTLNCYSAEATKIKLNIRRCRERIRLRRHGF